MSRLPSAACGLASWRPAALSRTLGDWANYTASPLCGKVGVRELRWFHGPGHQGQEQGKGAKGKKKAGSSVSSGKGRGSGNGGSSSTVGGNGGSSSAVAVSGNGGSSSGAAVSGKGRGVSKGKGSEGSEGK